MEPKCPFCGKKQTKRPKKRWKYKKYVIVSQYTCRCGKGFKFYSSPKSSWTIPKKKKS